MALGVRGNAFSGGDGDDFLFGEGDALNGQRGSDTCDGGVGINFIVPTLQRWNAEGRLQRPFKITEFKKHITSDSRPNALTSIIFLQALIFPFSNSATL